MLTDRERFKVAFMYQALRHGCRSLDETHALVKQANELFEKSAQGGFWSTLAKAPGQVIGKTLDVGSRIVSPLTKFLLGTAIMAPIGIGAATGYTLGRSDLSGESIDEAKRKELISAYRTATDRIKRKEKMRANRPKSVRASRSLV